jgi:hypothetical protein
MVMVAPLLAVATGDGITRVILSDTTPMTQWCGAPFKACDIDRGLEVVVR